MVYQTPHLMAISCGVLACTGWPVALPWTRLLRPCRSLPDLPAPRRCPRRAIPNPSCGCGLRLPCSLGYPTPTTSFTQHSCWQTREGCEYCDGLEDMKAFLWRWAGTCGVRSVLLDGPPSSSKAKTKKVSASRFGRCLGYCARQPTSRLSGR